MSALRLHATTVAIDGRGVMIMGPSGAGKSDLALRLIDRGAVLVSDDYTELVATDGRLIATSPSTIAGRMELRGIGVINLPHVSGVPVDLLIGLGEPVERMPQSATQAVLEVDLPRIALAPFEASTPIKVEIALSRLVRA